VDRHADTAKESEEIQVGQDCPCFGLKQVLALEEGRIRRHHWLFPLSESEATMSR
jgi:hypothetical protein